MDIPMNELALTDSEAEGIAFSIAERNGSLIDAVKAGFQAAKDLLEFK